MANLTAADNPQYPDIYELAVDDPVAGGPDGVDNLPHLQLAERTDWLRAAHQATAGQLDTVDTRLRSVEAASTGALTRALPLSWVYSDQGFDFELFAEGASWRDIAPADIVETVAGDESVDVSSTAGLRVGGTYVIHTAAGLAATVTVAEILTARRFRATAPLAVSLSAGVLARTSWTVEAGYAIAGNGGVLYSRRIDVLRYYQSGRVIVRRDEGDARLTLRYRPAAGGAWAVAELVATAQRTAGRRDEEYRLGIGGEIELTVAVAHGPSGDDMRIDHLVVLTDPAAGRAELVMTPAAVSPAEGTAGLDDTPLLVASVYRSLYGVAQAAARFRILLDPSGGTIAHDSGVLGAVTSYEVPAGQLAVDTTYFWTAQYRDADGVWSAWSTPAGFSTGAVFAYVARPGGIAPPDGMTAAPLAPTLQSTAFVVMGGADTHVKSQWQVAAAADTTFAAPVYDSGESADLVAHVVPAGTLAELSSYRWRVRHKGVVRGWSEWSVAAGFQTLVRPAAPVNTAPANGAPAVTLPPTLQSSAFFVPGGTSDTHVKSQWQVTTSADTTFSATVYDSGESADLVTHVVPGSAGLAALVAYRWRVRHKGAGTGWGDWSAATTMTMAAAPGTAVFTTPGTYPWVVPAGVTSVSVLCVGGGGAGGGPPPVAGEQVANSAGGGGGGGTAWKNAVAVTPGATVTIVVGAGGATGTAVNTRGAAGGTSSFGAAVSAVGGMGGYAGVLTYVGVGAAAGGDGGYPVGADGGGFGGKGGASSGPASGGGGGAGGYAGSGGAGATAGNATVATTSAASGSGGGGGGYGAVAGAMLGPSGGGIGLSGRGLDGFLGVAGSGGSGGASGSSSAGGTAGSGGAYGGGGTGGVRVDAAGVIFGGGGAGGAVRVIWGGGRSYPTAAA